MDLLIAAHRKLQPVVSALGLRKPAQKIFRFIYRRRFNGGRLVSAMQNGRTWQLDPEVAMRGALAEFETVEWLRQVVKPGDTVIDAGANVGQMTLEMAHLVGPSGRVLAIEPAPGNLAVLRRHVEANGFAERVIITAAACADRAGMMKFLVHGGHTDAVGSGHHICRDHEPADEEAQTIEVPVLTIDDVCAQHGAQPQVMKIDVEGAELLALRGAQNTLGRFRPVTRLAFHPFAFQNPTTAAAELTDLFARAGFEPVSPRPPDQWALDEYVFQPRTA